jgi:hypothetical protein
MLSPSIISATRGRVAGGEIGWQSWGMGNPLR